MILNEKINADNNFCKAYDALERESQYRIRTSIIMQCRISETTFYRWLQRPNLVTSYNDQYYIAYLQFGKPIKEFFEK